MFKIWAICAHVLRPFQAISSIWFWVGPFYLSVLRIIHGCANNQHNHTHTHSQVAIYYIQYLSAVNIVNHSSSKFKFIIISFLCLPSAATTLDIAQQVERNIAVGVNVFLIFIVPAEGFTIRITVTVGIIRICGSRTVQRPNCGFSLTYDWIRVVTVTVDVFITPEGLDADSQSAVGRRRRQADADVPMFVTVEGVHGTVKQFWPEYSNWR